MIYYVVPELIFQPTWGGDYIPTTKKLAIKDRIGQSYEFSTQSLVVPAKDIHKLKVEKYPYQIGTNVTGDEKLINKVKGIKPLKEIDIKDIFGATKVPDLLIKLTQAKGNSYQLHLKEKSGKFEPKAESWYFFGKGKVTLGIKPDADLVEYKETCENIYKFTKQISKKVKSKEMDIKTGRKEIMKYIEMHNPAKYVNTVTLNEIDIVDNYYGGIHHSWEEDVYTIPDGNILFEVQQDVKDDKSTIRCYDKGKLLDNGDYRKLNIDEYFENLSQGRKNNDPKTLIKTRIRLKDIKGWKLNKIFNNQYYQMDELIVRKDFRVSDLGFRHIYVKKGNGIIKTKEEEVKITEGHSYLIPASVTKIMIQNSSKVELNDMIILMTYTK